MKITNIYIKVLMMVACVMVTLFATAYAEDAGEKREKKQPARVQKAGLNMMELRQADADGDGKVSSQEFEAFQMQKQTEKKAAFMEADGNGDGTVDSEELRAMARRQLMDRAQYSFMKMDKNGDEALGKDEFIGSDEKFGQADSDGNGSVSKAEWLENIEKQVMDRVKTTRQEKPETKRGGSLFDRLDTNGDGSIDSNEAGKKTNFVKSADTDGDNAVSREEHDAFMKARKQQAGQDKAVKKQGQVGKQ